MKNEIIIFENQKVKLEVEYKSIKVFRSTSLVNRKMSNIFFCLLSVYFLSTFLLRFKSRNLLCGGKYVW